MSYFDTVFCNKFTLHGGALKASATHQSHLCAEIDPAAENELVAIHLNPRLAKRPVKTNGRLANRAY